MYYVVHRVLLFYQTLQRYATRAIHQSTRHTSASTTLFSIYFQSIGGRSVAHTNTHPKSLRLHAPLIVVPTSHLYLHGRSQRKSNAGLTPHSSAPGSCQYFTHPNIHRFLHLPRALVHIYSRLMYSY